MHTAIRRWFKDPDTPFTSSNQLAEAIAACEDAPFFGKSQHNIATFLYQIWNGKRPCSEKLQSSIDCAIRKKMVGMSDELVQRVTLDLHDALSEVKQDSLDLTTTRIEVIASFLVDSRNRGLLQALVDFGPEIDLPEGVVEQLITLSKQSPVPFSADTCRHLLGDLNKAEI